MKKANKFLTLLLIVASIMIVICSCAKDININPVGKWKCELYSSEQVIEFTKDGRFIDYGTLSENRYRLEGENVVTFVEGDPSSEVAIPYNVKGNTLVFGGLEYTRVEENSNYNNADNAN